MNKIISLYILLGVVCSNAISQSISVGLLGSFQPTLTEQRYGEHTYNDFFSVGGTIRVHFLESFPISTGLQINYGNKTLVDETPTPDPNAPIGTGPFYGYNRNIEVVDVEVPVIYNIFRSNTICFGAGVKLGVANIRLNDKIDFHDANTGAILSSFCATLSKQGFIFLPSAELSINSFYPFSFVVNVEYKFFEPSFTYDNVSTYLSPLMGSLGGTHIDYSYKLTGVQFGCMLLWSF